MGRPVSGAVGLWRTDRPSRTRQNDTTVPDAQWIRVQSCMHLMILTRFTRRHRSAGLSLRGRRARDGAHGHLLVPATDDIREGELAQPPIGRTVRPERFAAPDEVQSGRPGAVRRVTGPRACACERNGRGPHKETASALGRRRVSFYIAARTWEIDAFRAGRVPPGMETILPARIRRANRQSRDPERYPARTWRWLNSKSNTT